MKRCPIYLTFLFLFLKGVFAQEPKDNYVENNFDKLEVNIDMRDGTKLFTSIYTPKDTSKSYPILLNRTPYTVTPYGPNAYKTSLGNFPEIMEAGYIFVYQDVRGKWMSEGTFENIRPTRSETNIRLMRVQILMTLLIGWLKTLRVITEMSVCTVSRTRDSIQQRRSSAVILH